jgi:hypothetical protein
VYTVTGTMADSFIFVCEQLMLGMSSLVSVCGVLPLTLVQKLFLRGRAPDEAPQNKNDPLPYHELWTLQEDGNIRKCNFGKKRCFIRS